MNSLFICGCSFSADFYENNPNFFEYKKYMGGKFPKTWSEILSEKLKLNRRNFAEPSVGNDQIFHQFCSLVNELKEGDILILQWSYNFRYRWRDRNNTSWLHIGPGKIDESVMNKETHENILINRDSELYIKIVTEDYMKLIDIICEYKKVKLFYWCAGELFGEKIPDEKKFMMSDILTNFLDGDLRRYIMLNVCQNMNIVDETNGLINDGHNGKIGHEKQAELFYEYLIKNI